MFTLMGSALAAYFLSPIGMTQAFISSAPTPTRLEVVRPFADTTRDDAKRFLSQMDKIRGICRENDWELKATIFNGLRAGQTQIDQDKLSTAMRDQGFDKISVVTAEFSAQEKGKEFNTISFMLIYVQDASKWRLIEIEPLTTE